MGANAELVGLMGPQLELLLPVLDERSRRLVLGAVARAAGDGGTGAVAARTGASWQTVADGKAELESGDAAPEGRIRRPGGGRKSLAETDRGLVPALLALVEDSARGDPESPLVWTTKSVKHLSDALTGQGHRCSPQTAWRLLHGEGFSTQANAKVMEGRRHPDRDAQFRYIAAQAKEHLAAGQPVISVDAKKKEQIGQYAQDGQEWRRKGDPVQVRDHDFADAQAGHVIPYGVYDVAANTGFVNVGTDHNTAAFAVESVRRWWNLAGKDAYPGAQRLLVTCDAGGNNGWRNRAWKAGLAGLAQETGLEITCCHFPPGTSKWNKIEHRLFSQITLAWRGRPLTSHDVVVSTIGAVTTAAGLTVTAVLDHNSYPTGTQISDAQMHDIEDRALTRHAFHGGWNYTFLPAPRPAPPPQPEPAPAGPSCRDQAAAALAHPALTGITARDLDTLTARLELPAAAAREHDLHLARGHPRRRAAPAPPKLTLTTQLTATLVHARLGLPRHVLAYLLGVHPATLSTAIRQTRDLLARHDITLPAPAASLATLHDLHRYAATAGITIPGLPAGTSPQE
jgi:Rhodopirellula transposase DDE domain/Helix-turn-helix of DDE superfamily endonuclease